jgi:hypothetical protein
MQRREKLSHEEKRDSLRFEVAVIQAEGPDSP